MKFKKNKLFFLSSVVISLTPVIVASCGIRPIDQNNPNINPELEKKPVDKDTNPVGNEEKPTSTIDPQEKLLRQQSSNLIKADQKINYVAFGDSIAAGFDGTFDDDYKGQKLSNGAIDGTSYPAFLARALNVNNRVESFTNYAKTGSRIEDWNRILFDKANPLSQKEKIEYFGNNYESVIQKFKNDLQKANLITFSLGANDFIELAIRSLYEKDIVTDLFNSKTFTLDLNDVFEKLRDPIDEIIEYVRNELTKFIERLKTIAPNANINMVSYPLPLLGLEKTINKLIQENSNDKNFDLFNSFNMRINDVFKNVAQKTQINYVNTFNYDYWEKNKGKLTSLFFDIHPGINGYKKMALDIYLKITNRLYNKEQFDNLGSYNFSDEFINVDFKTAKYQIEVNNYKQILNFQFGDTTEKYLDNISNYEMSIIRRANFKNFGKRVKGILVKYIDTFYPLFRRLRNFDFYNSIDKDGRIFNYLSTIVNTRVQYGKFWTTRFHFLYQSLLEGNFLDELLASLQENLLKIQARTPNDLDKVFTTSEIKEVILESIKKPEVISALLDSLSKGPFQNYFPGLLLTIFQVLQNNNSPEAKQIKSLFGF